MAGGISWPPAFQESQWFRAGWGTALPQSKSGALEKLAKLLSQQPSVPASLKAALDLPHPLILFLDWELLLYGVEMEPPPHMKTWMCVHS